MIDWSFSPLPPVKHTQYAITHTPYRFVDFKECLSIVCIPFTTTIRDRARARVRAHNDSLFGSGGSVESER